MIFLFFSFFHWFVASKGWYWSRKTGWNFSFLWWRGGTHLWKPQSRPSSGKRQYSNEASSQNRREGEVSWHKEALVYWIFGNKHWPQHGCSSFVSKTNAWVSSGFPHTREGMNAQAWPKALHFHWLLLWFGYFCFYFIIIIFWSVWKPSWSKAS